MEFSTYLFFGKKGSGKTSMLAKMAYQYSKKGYRVFCTEENIKYTYHIPYSVIGQYWFPDDKPCLVLIDEIACLWNSRDFKTTPKAVRDYFRYTRHNKVVLMCFSQQFNDTDLQIRNQFDYLYMACRYGNWTIYKQIDKNCTLVSDINGTGQIAENYIYVPKFKPGARKLIYLPKYRKYFNSYSRLNIPDLPKEFYCDTIETPKKWYKKLIEKYTSRKEVLYNDENENKPIEGAKAV